ncbi:MAG: 4-hydroxybenzoate polyprenyltransferase [Myxococcota bacterium]
MRSYACVGRQRPTGRLRCALRREGYVAESVVTRTPASVALAAVKQLRPKQWTKNAFLFAALIFSAEFLDPVSVMRACIGFAAFCLLSSTGYVLNDFLDREADRKHPKKRFRPIASGALPIPMAWVLMLVIAVGGSALAINLSWQFLAIAYLYLFTTLSYSFYFKHRVILDVMVLSSGFVWRAIAGAIAIGVAVSPWLFLCTAFLALFLGFNKRRAELLHVGANTGTRRNLQDYSPKMLEQFQSIVTGSTVLCYALYTVNNNHTTWMVLTIPWVLYGVFRYIYLVDRHGEGGAPDETLLRDRPMLITGLGYVLTAMAVLVASQSGWMPDLIPTN